MNALMQDLRYALRQMRKSPGFTATIVVTLALGIGANTAIFTVLDALLLKMLPVRDPGGLVVVGDPTNANGRSNGTPRADLFSYPLYKELRDRNSVFSGLLAAASDHHVEVDTGQGGAPDQQVTGRMVSGNYFNVLGLRPAAGRLLYESDDTAEGANPVVVLAFGYWQRKFALSPSVVGKDIRLNGYPFKVVGVAPEGFDGDVLGEAMAFYVPLSMQPQIVRGRHWRNVPNTSWLLLIGRLKAGIAPSKAEANLNLIFQQVQKGDYGASLSADDRNAIRDLHINVSPGGGGVSALRGEYRLPLLLLMGIVALVLLIACVNVANLLLARASGRNREIAVRMAIGANRQRLFRQLLTESVLLGMVGGVAGCTLAISGVRLLIATFANDASLPLNPDLSVLLFAVAISFCSGILFGIVPALRTLQVRVSPALKDQTRTTADRGRFAWGKVLIIGQVALSVLVLFAAGLLVRSLQKLMTQDFGYSRDHLLVARLDAKAGGYEGEKMRLLAQQLATRVSQTPGIQGTTYSNNGLFAGTESGDAILVPGLDSSKIDDRTALEDYVGPNYFATLGIPILRGRGIEEQDTSSSPRVAVINQAMAKYFFKGQDPIGRQFRIDDSAWLDKPITIVGVAHNSKDHGSGLRQPVKPRFYLPFQQVPEPTQIAIEARFTGPPATALANLHAAIATGDPHLPMSRLKTLDDLVDESASNQIALAKLSAAFAGLALLLACIGIYGVMSYTVAGRTREIGVRMALGARPLDVVQMILREGMILIAVGIVVGIPFAVSSSRVLHTFLYGLGSADPVSLSIVVIVLGTVGALAGFIPARRAAKVDPVIALRYE